MGFFQGGVAILWRKWVKVSSVPADIDWGPYLRGRAIRAIWHSRWGPIGISSVYGVVDNSDDNMDLMGTVLRDNLSLGCQVMIGGDFNANFQYLRHGIGAVSSCLTHLDFGPTCFSGGKGASAIDYMLISKELGWVGGSTSTRNSVLATHRPLVWNMGSILAQKEVGNFLWQRNTKGWKTRTSETWTRRKGRRDLLNQRTGREGK